MHKNRTTYSLPLPNYEPQFSAASIVCLLVPLSNVICSFISKITKEVWMNIHKILGSGTGL